MARKARITEAGQYHIINRGVERRDVFLDANDYEKFLDLLIEMKKKFHINIHNFCLMTNHYHILLETSKPNISDAIKYLNSYYSIYFNKKYRRNGHLWQGRFHSYFLYDNRHFWIVAKYIEQNPLIAKMVKSINSYKYQSFFQWKYRSKYYKLLENSMIFDMTLKEYEEFINSKMTTDILDQIYSSPKFIKKDGEFKILYRRLETFFEEDKDFNRNENIKKAFEYGYKKSEIAHFLTLSHTAVSSNLSKY